MRKSAVQLSAALVAALSAASADMPEKPQIFTMSLDDGVLTGPGAALILDRLPSAQFILVGEDHGYADPPEIALAIAKAARKFGVVNHVAEIGPITDEWVEPILAGGGPDDLAAALEGQPLAVPFLVMREDAELADYFIDNARRRSDALWGVDQEFIGSATIHFETLRARAKSATAKALADSVLNAERDALAAGNLGALFMSSATPERFTELKGAFAGDKPALAVISALEESAAIYRAYNAGMNYASNADRIALMRRQFLDRYSKADRRPARALFKFGAIHLGRGTTFLNTFDLGSLTDGVAAGNGLDALRILILPLEGRQTKIMPSPEGFFTTVDAKSKDAAKLLEAIGVKAEDIPADGYAVIPLEPRRRALEEAGLSKLGADTRFFILGYDYLVTTRGARAANPLAR